jgi:hypothetical protein
MGPKNKTHMANAMVFSSEMLTFDYSKTTIISKYYIGMVTANKVRMD